MIKIFPRHDPPQVRNIRAHEGALKTLQFDPRREFLASVGADGKLKVFNYLNGDKEVAALDLVAKSPLITSVVSFSCFLLLSSYPNLITSFLPLLSLSSLSDNLIRFAWHPNGDSIAVPTPEGIVFVNRDWKVAAKFTDNKSVRSSL